MGYLHDFRPNFATLSRSETELMENTDDMFRVLVLAFLLLQLIALIDIAIELQKLNKK